MNLSNSEAMSADNLLNRIATKLVDSLKREFGDSPIECLRLIQEMRDNGITIPVESPIGEFEVECSNVLDARAEEAEARAIMANKDGDY
jgi:hypothetical protein